LTDDETEVTIEYIGEVGNQGFLSSHCRLKEHVDQILQARLGERFPAGGVGKQWTNHFVKKYSSKIKMSWSTPLKSKCGCAVNPHTKDVWFSLLQQIITDYGVEGNNYTVQLNYT
jgi:hypothetical protein